MEYAEILKRGFRITNRNLPAVLVQLLFSIAITVLLLALIFSVAAVFVGALAGLSLATLKPEDLLGVMKAPVSVLAAGAFLLVVFMVFSMVMTAFVQAGVTGCLVDTARGRAPGFAARGFFSHAKSSTFSMFRLFLLFGCIAVGTTLFFTLVSVVGFAVIMSLKDSGSQIAAFAVGFVFITALILSGLALFLVYVSGNFFAQVALVDERCGAVQALTSTYRFIRARFWDVLVFTIMVLVIVFIALFVIAALFGEFHSQTGLVASLMRQFKPLSIVETLVSLYVFLLMRSWFVVCYIPAQTAGPEEELLEAEILEPDATESGDTFSFDFDVPDTKRDEGEPPPAVS